MQDYLTFAEKDGVRLLDTGPCQCCGARTTRGIHECMELFNLGFGPIDYSNPAHHLYRFLSVDAHTLQHSEVHGRWNNHFHLTRQHLMLYYHIQWNYLLSPKLSDHLNAYKAQKADEFLLPPPVLQRGTHTITDVTTATTTAECQEAIALWAQSVYEAWHLHHATVDSIARSFLDQN